MTLFHLYNCRSFSEIPFQVFCSGRNAPTGLTFRPLLGIFREAKVYRIAFKGRGCRPRHSQTGQKLIP